jgi:hypothetical protein
MDKRLTKGILISKTRARKMCAIDRSRIEEGVEALRFRRYSNDKSVSGIWIKIESLTILIDSLTRSEKKDFNKFCKVREGVNISMYSKKTNNHTQCPYCLNKIDKGEYSLCLSDDERHNPNSVRVHKECISQLKNDLDNLKSNIAPDIIPEKI